MRIQRASRNSGVSSVVGVILMVALTVILAAVLGQFIFDLASVLNKPIQAGVTIQEQPHSDPLKNTYNVTVILTDKQTADKVIIRDGSGVERPPLTKVGANRQLKNISKGSMLTIIGVRDGQRTVLQTHTVGS